MYKDLPEALKREIHFLLDHDNFVAAKEKYDEWVSLHPPFKLQKDQPIPA